MIDKILEVTEKLGENDRALVTGETDIGVSRLDREAVLIIRLLEKAGYDPGMQTVIAMRLLFWLNFMYSGIGDEVELPDEIVCPACGYRGLEPDEEQNIDDFGPAWPEQPHERLTWFCPNCELAGTLKQIEADKNLVLPWKGA